LHPGGTNASETQTYHQTLGGWPMILSGLKTLLETGDTLRSETPEAAVV
jgi:hypothetical protein